MGRGVERFTQACEEEGYPRPPMAIRAGQGMGAFSIIEEQKSQPRKTSEGVGEQEKILLELIGSSPGKRTPYYAEQMQTPRKNVER